MSAGLGIFKAPNYHELARGKAEICDLLRRDISRQLKQLSFSSFVRLKSVELYAAQSLLRSTRRFSIFDGF
jgi:hypothetical protein